MHICLSFPGVSTKTVYRVPATLCVSRSRNTMSYVAKNVSPPSSTSIVTKIHIFRTYYSSSVLYLFSSLDELGWAWILPWCPPCWLLETSTLCATIQWTTSLLFSLWMNRVLDYKCQSLKSSRAEVQRATRSTIGLVETTDCVRFTVLSKQQ